MSKPIFLRQNFRGVAPLLLLAFALALTGCTGTRGGPIPYKTEGLGVPDAPQAFALAADYRISPLDKLRVTVFQVDALSGEYQVDLTGHVALPLIGSVPVVGLTVSESQARLAGLFGERYLNRPDVTVGVIESTQSVLTIDGAVRAPGVHQVRGPLTLMQAVALAGGANAEANLRRVAVFRQIEGQRMAAAFDLARIRRGQEPDPAIYRGDVVIVDGAGLRGTLREVMSALPLLSIFSPVL